MSIIDPKYKGKYNKDSRDWLAEFIDDNVAVPVLKMKTVTDEDGNKTEEEVNTGKTQVDLEKLFKLAENNSINATERYGDQIERKNAAGRLRMTLGNMLRAAARKRHGLYDVDGDWVEADEDFIGDHERTQNRDGSKIVAVKDEEEAA